MAKIGELLVKIGADASQLKKGLEESTQKIAAVGERMKSIGQTMTMGVTLPILAGAGAAVKLASDMSESVNKVNVAFKDSAGTVNAWSDTALKSFGIAKGTALDMASTYGDMATSLGLNTQQAADMSTRLVGLAGDLASFKNISIDVANTALTGVFTGETESLKQLGIVMTQANLQEFAYSQGIKKKVQDMTQAEQVQLRYNYVLEKTNNAQGDFSRTSDSLANQSRMLGESLKELGETIGEKLNPHLEPIVKKLNEWVQKFEKLDEKTQKIIIVIGLLAAVLGPLMVIFGAILAALPAMAAGFAILTGPVGLVTAAIALLVAGGVALWQNWDEIKAKGAAIWDGIKTYLTTTWQSIINFGNVAWTKFKDGFLGVWNTIVNGIKGYVNSIIRMVNAIIRALNTIQVTIPDWVPGYGGEHFGINIPSVPYLAEGGIVTKPTLAVIGEAGPEAVVPLNKGYGTGATIGNINIYGNNADEIWDNFERKLALSGVRI